MEIRATSVFVTGGGLRRKRPLWPFRAAGVDGEAWGHYGEALEANLADPFGRLERGAYRARPVQRVYSPKADGRQRPLDIPTLEDKLVQRAAVDVVNAIYEIDFLGFSYGCRPGRIDLCGRPW